MAHEATAPTAGEAGERRRRRVPVEERLAGLERRSIVPALVVVGIWFLWVVAVPHLDAAVDHDDPVVAGERFAISDDLAVTPPPGWDVIDGFRTTDIPAGGAGARAEFTNGTVTIILTTDTYDGTASELLEQIDKVTSATGAVDGFTVTDGRSTVTTDSGLTGVAETFTGRGVEGTVAAFVSDGTGIEVSASGQPDQESAAARHIAHLIHSIGPWDSTDAGQQEAS
jgi:hypothetical protein